MMNVQTAYTQDFFGEIVVTNPNANENMTVHFKVKDYNAWRTSYNGHEKERATAGIPTVGCFGAPMTRMTC
jgi:hypothetical protein